MNFNETEKLNLSVKSKPETSIDNGSENLSSLSPEEKTKTEKETILIKNPEPLNIRELFKEKIEREKQVKVEYREKQISESTVKNIKEAEIRISKSTEEVLNLIKQSKADLPKVVNKSPQPEKKNEPVIVRGNDPDPKLNKIIQEEISKLKEEVKKSAVEKPKDEAKPDAIKFSQPKRTPEPITKEQVKITVPVKPVVENKTQQEKKIVSVDKTVIARINDVKPKAAESIESISRAKTVESEQQKIRQKPIPPAIEKEIPKSESTKDIMPQSVLKDDQKENAATSKKGLIELSSLTPEEKRAFFKAQKEKSEKNKNILKVVAASITIIISAVVLFSFVLSGSDEVIDKKIVSQTKSATSEVLGNQLNQTAAMTQPQEKVDIKSSNPTPNTENLSLPPLPEIQGLDEPIVDLIKGENPTQEVAKDSGSKEKVNLAPPKENKIEEEEPPYFVAVEQMPEPIGGLAEIQKRVVYPNIALQTGIEGKVFVRALINEAGVVTQTEILKGIGAGCDEAAADAVAKTKFKPGIQRGKPVKVQMTIPIVFKKGQ